MTTLQTMLIGGVIGATISVMFILLAVVKLVDWIIKTEKKEKEEINKIIEKVDNLPYLETNPLNIIGRVEEITARVNEIRHMLINLMK